MERKEDQKRISDKLGDNQMKVRQGDVFWILPDGSNRIASDYAHPHVVIQDDTSSAVIVCALTTNLKRAKAPGNVLLDMGEANLPMQSVVVVSQAFAVDKTQLGEFIGTLTEQRINQIVAGRRFLQIMTRHHDQAA